MNVKVTFDGLTMIEGVKSGEVIQIKEGTDIAGLLYQFHVKEEFHSMVIPFVNDKPKKLSYMLKDRDELVLFLPVSGG